MRSASQCLPNVMNTRVAVLQLPSPGIETPTLTSLRLIPTSLAKEKIYEQSGNHPSPPYTYLCLVQGPATLMFDRYNKETFFL